MYDTGLTAGGIAKKWVANMVRYAASPGWISRLTLRRRLREMVLEVSRCAGRWVSKGT